MKIGKGAKQYFTKRVVDIVNMGEDFRIKAKTGDMTNGMGLLMSCKIPYILWKREKKSSVG
jgi:hypothetical protein